MCAGSQQSDSSADVVCLRAIFQGRVQGVGFRYRTSRLAQQYPITGFVKNLSDGTVELVAQASSKSILDQFFEDMMLMFAANVTDVSIQEATPNPAWSQFEIKR
ncbi:acylphosphatase [uncultured Gimesia sp.]|uniref:acylphosphatase n=1 Tax=uncultured Gimesia sp. TaxID=1678688 RepID=UPI0030DC2159|tara:strand:- start:28888 stop:29199 length:312 start_codon:yes stop_codon:yes gene_type:complete